MGDRRRISTDGGEGLGYNPFGSLKTDGFAPGATAGKSPETAGPAKANGRAGRQRIDIRREKSGRGGKTVTVVSGLAPLGPTRIEALARSLRKALGVGGAVKGNCIEFQGDQREKLAAFFRDEGFRPVLSGG
jgi:translation initiation factor 1